MDKKVNNFIWTEDINKRIVSLMQLAGKNPEWFAKQMNVDAANVSRIKNNKANVGLELLMKFAKVLNVSLDSLVYGKEKTEAVIPVGKSRLLKVYAGASCGNSSESWQELDEQFIEMEGLGHLTNPFIVKAEGLSMSQTILPDDLIVAYDGGGLPKNHKLCLVSFKSNPDTRQGAIKRIIKLNDKQILLYSDNSRNYPPYTVELKDVEKVYHIYKKIIRELK